MKKKTKYRIRNWKQYNQSLRNRGSLTFWISQDLIDNWIRKEKSTNRGASVKYSNAAIQTMAQVKFVFHQAGRQTTGLIASVFELMKLKLPVPDHSTLSRRMARLEIRLPIKPGKRARHVVCDSTGVKVYGEGEWKVRTYGASKRRTWRKLHLQIDEATGEILAAGGSENSVSDCQMFAEMLSANEEEIEQISGDGAFDRKKVYQAIKERTIGKAAVPPRKGARIWRHGNRKAERLIRDENLRAVRRRGRRKWKEESNYHRRSLAETGVFRFKTVFSDKLQSREIENQFSEMIIKCAVLNQMTHLGMPDSYKVAT